MWWSRMIVSIRSNFLNQDIAKIVLSNKVFHAYSYSIVSKKCSECWRCEPGEARWPMIQFQSPWLFCASLYHAFVSLVFGCCCCCCCYIMVPVLVLEFCLRAACLIDLVDFSAPLALSCKNTRWNRLLWKCFFQSICATSSLSLHFTSVQIANIRSRLWKLGSPN